MTPVPLMCIYTYVDYSEYDACTIPPASVGFTQAHLNHSTVQCIIPLLLLTILYCTNYYITSLYNIIYYYSILYCTMYYITIITKYIVLYKLLYHVLHYTI